MVGTTVEVDWVLPKPSVGRELAMLWVGDVAMTLVGFERGG